MYMQQSPMQQHKTKPVRSSLTDQTQLKLFHNQTSWGVYIGCDPMAKRVSIYFSGNRGYFSCTYIHNNIT